MNWIKRTFNTWTFAVYWIGILGVLLPGLNHSTLTVHAQKSEPQKNLHGETHEEDCNKVDPGGIYPEGNPPCRITGRSFSVLNLPTDWVVMFLAKDGTVMFSQAGIVGDKDAVATNVHCDPLKEGDPFWHGCKATSIKHCP